MTTPEERLAALDEAIHAIMVTGQEYKHEGRWLRRADLSVLLRQRNQLAEEVAAGTDGRTSVAVFEGR